MQVVFIAKASQMLRPAIVRMWTDVWAASTSALDVCDCMAKRCVLLVIIMIGTTIALSAQQVSAGISKGKVIFAIRVPMSSRRQAKPKSLLMKLLRTYRNWTRQQIYMALLLLIS